MWNDRTNGNRFTLIFSSPSKDRRFLSIPFYHILMNISSSKWSHNHFHIFFVYVLFVVFFSVYRVMCLLIWLMCWVFLCVFRWFSFPLYSSFILLTEPKAMKKIKTDDMLSGRGNVYIIHKLKYLLGFDRKLFCRSHCGCHIETSFLYFLFFYYISEKNVYKYMCHEYFARPGLWFQTICT